MSPQDSSKDERAHTYQSAAAASLPRPQQIASSSKFLSRPWSRWESPFPAAPARPLPIHTLLCCEPFSKVPQAVVPGHKAPQLVPVSTEFPPDGAFRALV